MGVIIQMNQYELCSVEEFVMPVLEHRVQGALISSISRWIYIRCTYWHDLATKFLTSWMAELLKTRTEVADFATAFLYRIIVGRDCGVDDA